MNPSPIRPLGITADGRFAFLDTIGQLRLLTDEQLQGRHELLSLFLGNDAWLRAWFPKRITVKRTIGEAVIDETIVVDFRLADAALYLMAECRSLGLFVPPASPSVRRRQAPSIHQHRGDPMRRMIGRVLWWFVGPQVQASVAEDHRTVQRLAQWVDERSPERTAHLRKQIADILLSRVRHTDQPPATPAASEQH